MMHLHVVIFTVVQSLSSAGILVNWLNRLCPISAQRYLSANPTLYCKAIRVSCKINVLSSGPNVKLAPCGPGAISLPLSLYFPLSTLSYSIFYLLFPFLLASSIFLLFHPFRFYQNSSTPFPGQMS